MRLQPDFPLSLMAIFILVMPNQSALTLALPKNLGAHVFSALTIPIPTERVLNLSSQFSRMFVGSALTGKTV